MRQHASLDTAHSGQALQNQVSQKQADNPYKIQLSKLLPNVGDELHFRILSLSADHCRKLEVVYSDKRVEPKGKTPFTTSVETHLALIVGDPEEIISQNDLSSFSGKVQEQDKSWSTVNLAELQSKSKYRIPVFVYGVQPGKDGADFKDMNAPMFLELSYSQWRSLNDLEKTRNVDLTFDENTFKPQYDVIITRAKEKGEGTYAFDGLAFDSPGKPAATYNVPDKQALGDDNYAKVQAEYEKLQEAMDEFQTPEQIRYALGGPAAARGAMPAKPSFPGGNLDEVETPVEEEETNRTVTSGRGRGSAKKEEEPAAPPAAGAQTAEGESEEGDTNRNFGFSRRGKKAA